jgi:hypothetical protein
MLSTDKQASHEAGEPGARAAGAAGDGGSGGPAPTASLFALPGGGARQRLLAAARRPSDMAPGEPAAGAAGREAANQPAAASEQESASRDSLLYSKGDASASGFRPWYWSYERDGGPPPSDSAGTTTRLPAGAPASVSPPDPVSAPATSSEPPRRAVSLPMALLAGFSALALGAGATLFVLSRAPPPHEAPALALVAPPPEPAPLPQKPIDTALPAPPAPPPEAAPPPPPEPPKPAAAPPAVLAQQEIATLMARGDQLLATGDVAGARLFYERAAEGGSAPAATAAGKTYDPLFLAEANARFVRGDPVAAARWYRKASAGGDKEADGLMQRLMTKYAG